MKKKLIFPTLFIFNLSFSCSDVQAQDIKPDTIKVVYTLRVYMILISSKKNIPLISGCG